MPPDLFDPDRPPEPEPGCAPAPPDFIGIGVQKAGTTWWYDLVAAHPEVYHREGRPKELHYFDRFWGDTFSAADVDTYHRWFARPSGFLAGEWTPRYLHDWWVPRLLSISAPDARYLVMLRDPVERYRSGVAHELRSRGRRDPAIPGDALRRSCYADQLERLFEVVSDDRVLVLQFERCAESPKTELRRTYAFLGLDDDFAPEDLITPKNVTQDPRPSVPADIGSDLVRELAADTARLATLVPELDLGRWNTGAT